MKNMILGLALACLTFACASEKKASMADAQPVNPTKVECPSKSECGTKSDCTDMKEGNGAKKEGCEASAGAKTCTMTGKVQG